jgi:hypothetical protein
MTAAQDISLMWEFGAVHLVSTHSRQSAQLFSSSRNWDSPNPLPNTHRRVCPPPPLVPGGMAHSLAREGVGESQFRRGDIHCGTLYVYMYFVG